MKQYNSQYFKYIALDKQLGEIQDITCYVEQGGTIEYNSLTSLKASCDIPISLDINEKLNLDAIRIYEVLNGTERPLGTFLIANPSANFTDSIQSTSCVGYSTLWRINANTPSGKFYLPKGTNCINEIKRILDTLGYEYDISESEGTTSTNREWEIGTSYLDIINDLLTVVNYTSLYVDEMGNYIAKPYVLPNDREIELTLDEDDVDNVLEQHLVSEIDLFNIPNKFIRYCSSSPELALYAEYENVYGETGTNNTWTQVDAQEVQDVANYDTLYEMCKKACADANSIYHKVQIATAIQPISTYMSTIQLHQYQVNDKYSCTSFVIHLETGGSLEMNLRKIISII